MILGDGKLAGRKEEEVKGGAAADRQKVVCKCRQVPLCWERSALSQHAAWLVGPVLAVLCSRG